VEEIIRASGVPRAAFATYEFHQTEDVEHRKEIEEMLDRVPANAILRQAIIQNGLRCAGYYRKSVEAMLEGASNRSTPCQNSADRNVKRNRKFASQRAPAASAAPSSLA